MLSRSAPSKKGSASLTLKRRARRPSVLSIRSDASISQSAFTASPWKAATSIRSASTAPLAVYRCTATAFDLNQEGVSGLPRSEEHTSELQSHSDLVCRLLLEKKK